MESNVADTKVEPQTKQNPASASEDGFVRSLATIHKSLKLSKNLKKSMKQIEGTILELFKARLFTIYQSVDNGKEIVLKGKGTGPIDAFLTSLNAHILEDFKVVGYHEHALGHGASTDAIAYVEMAREDGTHIFGVGRHANITKASLTAVVSAVNRALAK